MDAVNALTTPEFENARPILLEAINKIVQFAERGGEKPYPLSVSELMNLYSIVYDLRVRVGYVGPNESHIHRLYRQAFENHINSQVLPSLRGKKSEELLQELLKRWNGHKIMSNWLYKIFQFLDRYYTPRRRFPTLHETNNSNFFNLVYLEMKDDIRDAVLSLIDRERDGEQIDKITVKEVIRFYIEIVGGSMAIYIQDFEPELLNSTAAYYSKKARGWIKAEKTIFHYLAKVEECLTKESDRVREYLQVRSDLMLRQRVEHELMGKYPQLLQEKLDNDSE